jgi:hypothetical protein
MRFKKSQPAGAATLVPPSTSRPTEKYGCTTPRTKSARPRNARKSWQHFEHLRTAMALTGRYEKRLSTKPV